jgi:hypothetical protein
MIFGSFLVLCCFYFIELSVNYESSRQMKSDPPSASLSNLCSGVVGRASPFMLSVFIESFGSKGKSKFS